MYGGWLLKWTGLGIAVGSPFTVGPALLLTIAQIITACFEEKNLHKAFGEAWDAYRLSVKRRFVFSWEGVMLAAFLTAWSLQAFL
jgi:protein-S-isoprenylcysteine O-methyltransferase Ste14